MPFMPGNETFCVISIVIRIREFEVSEVLGPNGRIVSPDMGRGRSLETLGRRLRTL